MFWQAGSQLRFISISPESNNWHGTLTIAKDNVTFDNVSIPENIEEQKDLVIGSALASADEHMNGKGVDLTLNHILSQIIFKAKNTNKRLTYRIGADSIVHAANSETYTNKPGTTVG